MLFIRPCIREKKVNRNHFEEFSFFSIANLYTICKRTNEMVSLRSSKHVFCSKCVLKMDKHYMENERDWKLRSHINRIQFNSIQSNQMQNHARTFNYNKPNLNLSFFGHDPTLHQNWINNHFTCNRIAAVSNFLFSYFNKGGTIDFMSQLENLELSKNCREKEKKERFWPLDLMVI